MTQEPEQRKPAEDYEPPQVKDIPAQDGPAVTAAGGTGDIIVGAEWRLEAGDADASPPSADA